MKYNKAFVFLTLAVLCMFGCSKEYSLETGGAGGPGGGGGNTLTQYGWKFTGKQTDNYHGCIDTAYYETNGTAKALFVEGTDSAGNYFVVLLVSPNGNITAGTYNISQGASMTVIDQLGNTFIAQPPSSFTLQVTKINDTIVEGNFSGTLTDNNTNTTLAVTKGQIKALIGKENPCNGSTPGGGNNDAVFTLVASGANCSNAVIDGSYVQNEGLDPSNTVTFKVDVTTPGDWDITTTARNGMTFSGSGTFTTTGAHTIVLTGEGSPSTVGDNVIPVQAGSSTCNFTIPVKVAVVAVQGNRDYFPITANSNWIYEFSDAGSGYVDSFQTVSTGQNVTIATQTYAVFDNDLFSGVYRTNNGSYFRYGPIDYFDVVDSSKKAETIFLKDNVAEGSTWESPVMTSTATKFKKRYTVVQKNVAKVVKGVLFNNVISVKEELMIEAGAFGFSAVDATILSYAKGVGLIQGVNADYGIQVKIKRYTVN